MYNMWSFMTKIFVGYDAQSAHLDAISAFDSTTVR